jgi:hypothetical protein
MRDALSILELDDVKVQKVFFCGKTIKFGIPNTLLISVNDDDVMRNRFYSDMRGGIASGGSYVGGPYMSWSDCPIQNRYWYNVITSATFNFHSLSKVIDERWEYRTLETMVDIYKDMIKVHNLAVFL